MTPATMLSTKIQPKDRYLRAANIEAHHEQVEHYIPTSRALEVLRRLVASMGDSSAGRSWSLTGPYGAGKSSFALYLRTILGPDGPRRDVAERALRNADEELCKALVSARETASPDGFVLATTTCQQEPVGDSLLRALVDGVVSRWPNGTPANVVEALKTAQDVRSARAIAEVVRTVSTLAPVLIVLDEFGKTLEHFAGHAESGTDSAADLFVLQELAEQSIGSYAAPSFTFTLQHLAFDDYVRQASAQQRREWGKVQGRFEDVSFLESAEQSLRLVAGALDDSRVDSVFEKRRQMWARDAFSAAREVGIARSLPGGADTVKACYPLHPVALLALPELCGQLGQHGRTLFGFLTSSEPGTARSFLESTRVPTTSDALPVLFLSDLFDFFAGSGYAMALSTGGSRWREIHERVAEAATLDPLDLKVLKTVGLLNLMANSRGLRASPELVSFALSNPAGTATLSWRNRLEDLETRGFLTFRSYADEYRLWQGSDVDLRSRVADAREQLRSTNAAELLARLHSDTPVIAGRHSQHVGMLRYFAVTYTDDGTRTIPSLKNNDPADGSVVYHLGSPESTGQMKVEADQRPTVLVTSVRAKFVRDAAIEVAAALAVLDQQEVLGDRVARRELQDRVADARNRLSQAIAHAFRPGSQGVEFRLVSSRGVDDPIQCLSGLSRLLSNVCDDAYHQSPQIPNEMLGRRYLTSQGAKARRVLIGAMINNSHEERLGINGFGPERAMYEAVLRHTGLHREHEGEWSFGKPGLGGALLSVWGAIAQFVNAASDAPVTIDRLYERLMLPPIGLKEGPIPVILVAYLLHCNDSVAIYEEGSFQPNLTSELMERLVKAPQRFALKSFETVGSRAQVLAAVSKASEALGISGIQSLSESRLRNATVLAVAAPLLNLVRNLPTFTRKTSNLTPQALAVRNALLEAREPDQLLFVDLPAATGYKGDDWKSSSTKTIEDFSEKLQKSLAELQGAMSRQLDDICLLLAEAFDRPANLPDLRNDIRTRAALLQGKVREPKLQAFIFSAADDSSDDHGWLGRIGLSLIGKAVELWLDDDRTRFNATLNETAAAFHRVEAIHFDVRARSFEGPVTARRLTFTTPEGDEASRVVYYDEAKSAELSELVNDLLVRVDEVVGDAHGRDGIIALLVERVLRGTGLPGLGSS